MALHDTLVATDIYIEVEKMPFLAVCKPPIVAFAPHLKIEVLRHQLLTAFLNRVYSLTAYLLRSTIFITYNNIDAPVPELHLYHVLWLNDTSKVNSATCSLAAVYKDVYGYEYQALKAPKHL